MKRLIILAAAIFCIFSCDTKFDTIDTGVANGRFNGNMYDYLASDSYNWDSIRLMIDKAGLTDLFKGTRAGYEKITFFGPTNHSIRRWMIDNHPDNINLWRDKDGNKHLTIADLTIEQCHDFVMRHVLKGKTMREEFPYGKLTYDDWGYLTNVNGGGEFTAELGNKVWICCAQIAYKDIVEAGPKVLKIRPVTNYGYGAMIEVASADIEPDNGVVHALQYSYTFGNF